MQISRRAPRAVSHHNVDERVPRESNGSSSTFVEVEYRRRGAGWLRLLLVETFDIDQRLVLVARSERQGVGYVMVSYLVRILVLVVVVVEVVLVLPLRLAL